PVDRRQPGAQQLLGSRRQTAQDARRFEPDALHGSAADHDDPAVLPGSGLPIADSVAALYRKGVEYGRAGLDGGGLAEPELGPDPRPEPSAGTGTLQPGDFHAAQMADVYRPHAEPRLGQGLDPRHRLGRRIGRGGPVQRQVQREAVDLLSAERLSRERQIGAGKALASQRAAAIDDHPVSGEFTHRVDRGGRAYDAAVRQRRFGSVQVRLKDDHITGETAEYRGRFLRGPDR